MSAKTAAFGKLRDCWARRPTCLFCDRPTFGFWLGLKHQLFGAGLWVEAMRVAYCCKEHRRMSVSVGYTATKIVTNTYRVGDPTHVTLLGARGQLESINPGWSVELTQGADGPELTARLERRGTTATPPPSTPKERPACRARGSNRGLATEEWACVRPAQDGDLEWVPRDIAGEPEWDLRISGWLFACRPCQSVRRNRAGPSQGGTLMDAPTHTVVREFDCELNDAGDLVRMVELSCGHADRKVHEDGTDPGNERKCWTCWREHRDQVLAERRARKRSEHMWRTAVQMAEAWGTSVVRVSSYITKLGLRDLGEQHVRGGGEAREYSPAAQELIKREWRSYGRPR